MSRDPDPDRDTALLYALEYARDTFRKTAHIYVATTSIEALLVIEKGQKVRDGREVAHKIADAVLENEERRLPSDSLSHS